jgi:hypothetical protein
MAVHFKVLAFSATYKERTFRFLNSITTNARRLSCAIISGDGETQPAVVSVESLKV